MVIRLANRLQLRVGQRVSRKYSEELGTVTQATRHKARVTWDGGQTSYFDLSRPSDLRLYLPAIIGQKHARITLQLLLEEGFEMTLTRGAFLGFDYNRMVVLFTMKDRDADVPCAISTAALDALDQTRGAQTPEQREAQFLRLRDQVEDCASRKYHGVGREGNPPGLILRSIDFNGL
jgi:hypothetical protein